MHSNQPSPAAASPKAGLMNLADLLSVSLRLRKRKIELDGVHRWVLPVNGIRMKVPVKLKGCLMEDGNPVVHGCIGKAAYFAASVCRERCQIVFCKKDDCSILGDATIKDFETLRAYLHPVIVAAFERPLTEGSWTRTHPPT